MRGRQGQDQARFGVLKKVNLDPPAPVESKSPAPVEGKRRRAAAGPVKIVPFDNRSRGSARTGVAGPQLDRREPTYFQYYYYYALERACTLAGAEQIGEHDWYDEISDGLLKQQKPDGSWSGMTPPGSSPNTAFVLLFLSRATAKLMKHHPDEKLFGGGLMIGGRGLPTNLSAVQAGADGIKVRKLDAPVDQLLSELENPQSAKVEAAQQAIVESVELGDREKLVGQKDRLARLARDPRVEVRRTAIWALGRCATIHEARFLVKATRRSRAQRGHRGQQCALLVQPASERLRATRRSSGRASRERNRPPKAGRSQVVADSGPGRLARLVRECPTLFRAQPAD